jgi:hypothetical protein
VRDSVRDSVWASVEASVRASVRDSVWDSVRDSVSASVWTSVWDSVRDSVRDSVEYTPSAYYGNISDYGWVAFYNYFERVGIVDHANFREFSKLTETGIYDSIQLEGLCIICENPLYIHRDEQNRMHCLTGPAIEWADTYGVYAIHGVRFPDKDMFEKIAGGQMTFAEVMALENIEQRMIALKLLGAEKLLDTTDAKLINKSFAGNELYLIKDIFPEPAYFLKYKCPSTDRVYVSGVDPQVGIEADADKAMGWKFGLNVDEYRSIEAQS